MTRSAALRALLLGSLMLAVLAPSAGAFGFVNGLNMNGGGPDGDLLQLGSQLNIARDSSGTFYIADGLNRRVLKTDSDGKLITEWGVQGSGDSQFQGPSGIALGPDGNVYVADSSANCVKVFDSDGDFVRKIGTGGSGDGQLSSPNGLAFDPSGYLLVADTNNNRVQRFDTAGNFQNVIGDSIGPGALYRPRNVAVGSNGKVYVLEGGTSGHGRVVIFSNSSSATYMLGFAGYGDNQGQFILPEGLWIVPGATPDDDQIFVSESWNHHRVQRFSATGQYLSGWGFDNGETGTGGTPGYGTAPGEMFVPTSVIVDSAGDAWVANSGNHRIDRYSDAFSGSGATYVSSFGTDGRSPGQFDGPQAVAVAPDGTAYVAESVYNEFARIQHVSAKGKVLDSFGEYGTATGQLNSVGGLAVAANGDIWVADGANDRVQHFGANGAHFGTLLGGNGLAFSYPSDVAIAPDGNVLVSDEVNSRIVEFTSGGVYVTTWGTFGTSDGQLNRPGGVEVSPDGQHVYVADYWGNRIQRFSRAGAFEAKSGDYDGLGHDTDGAFNMPWGVALDPTSGELLVADQNNNRIQRLSSDLTYVSKFGGYGRGEGQFSSPIDLAVDSHGYVWVADRDNDRVQRFGNAPAVELAALPTTTEATSVNVAYTVDDAGANCTADSGASVALNVGANLISVTCTNAQGDDTATATVTRTAPVFVPPPVVTIEPSLTLAKKLKLTKKRKLTFKATCPDGCSVGGKLKIGKKSAKLKSAALVGREAAQSVSFTLSKSTYTKVLAALKKKQAVTLTVTVQSYKATQGKTGKAKISR